MLWMARQIPGDTTLEGLEPPPLCSISCAIHTNKVQLTTGVTRLALCIVHMVQPYWVRSVKRQINTESEVHGTLAIVVSALTHTAVCADRIVCAVCRMRPIPHRSVRVRLCAVWGFFFDRSAYGRMCLGHPSQVSGPVTVCAVR